MQIFFFQTLPFHLQKALLLTAVFTYILAGNFLPLWADADYQFRDANYEIITLPSRPVISMQKPGLFVNEAPAHIPKIRIKSRREGLEKIRLLEFEFPVPVRVDPLENDRRMAVYILDKDGLMVGYQALNAAEPRFKIKINSVINYVQVYVECHKHGLWFEEFYIQN